MPLENAWLAETEKWVETSGDFALIRPCTQKR